MHNCEDCDRNNVIKAFCYYSRNKKLFEELHDSKFTLESFAIFAVNLNLSWRITPCAAVPRAEFVMYWHLIEDLLKKELQKQTSEALQSTSNIYID